MRSTPRRVVALVGTHLTVLLALSVGASGVAVGLFLPPGGPSLAWFVPLVDGAGVLSLVVAVAMASIDVIVRQERSALPYVGIGATVGALWLAHLLSFTGVLWPTLVGARDGGLLLHAGRIAMPALLIWALLQRPGPLANPRRSVAVVVAVALTAAGVLIGAAVGLDSIFRSIGMNVRFTDVNTALLNIETLAVAMAIGVFALGHRGDPRFAGARTGAIILLGFEAIVQALSKAPYDAAWYSAAALRLDPPLLLMVGLLSLYGPSLRAERIAEARHAEAMREGGQHSREVLDNVVDGLITFDENERIESFNPSARRLLGYEAGEVIGHDLRLLIAESHQNEFLAQLRGTLRPGKRHARSPAYETQGRRKDGSTFALEFSVNQVQLDTGRLHIGLLRDITERKAQTEALEYRTLHDSLTGLPNRMFLADRLEQALLAAERERQPRALLFLDLNGFKQINDRLGHHQGDRVLQEVARRLRRVLRKADTVARIGGDEFAVLPAGATDTPHAILVAETILGALKTPFRLDQHRVHVGTSIGIALYPEHGEDAATLTGHADIGMYVAKRAQTGYCVYTTELGI